MGRQVRSFLFGLLVLSLLGAPIKAQRETMTHEEARALDHQDPTWLTVSNHLPNPQTATAAQLETAADVLRARRFLEDALDYYGYAISRGGHEVALLNKMGITELELQRPVQARAFFQRVVKMNKKEAEGWNNLGAIEYLGGRLGTAVSDYKRAIKLDKTSASFHSNLATAYFDEKQFDSARKEYDVALKLDPDLLQHHGTVGSTTRMLSPEDHARFCYELARLYASRGDEQQMLHFLTMASEAGFDVLHEMSTDSVLGRYRKDPRVLLLVKNSHDLRTNQASIDAPQLPPAQR